MKDFSLKKSKDQLSKHYHKYASRCRAILKFIKSSFRQIINLKTAKFTQDDIESTGKTEPYLIVQ